jgi:hypothetical protein
MLNSTEMDNLASSTDSVGAPKVTLEEVLAKCNYFNRVHLWPLRTALDPEAWLRNFKSGEVEHAVHLLNAFMYFNRELVIEMFASCVQALSRREGRRGDSYITALSSWQQFFDRSIVVPVAGDRDNPSDSGFSFARIARQHLGFNELQIMSPGDAISEIARGPRPVIFVDDFVGTGSQFAGTWFREFKTASGTTTSFSAIASVRGTRFYYCPVLCTQDGVNEISLQCPTVELNSAHVIDDSYSALNSNSRVWPSHLRSTAFDFLESASKRAGIPDTGGGSPDDWRGYEQKGLNLAILDTIPDATLGLLRWKQNGWKPLMVKS